jgi:hypothetical protein
MVAVWSGFRAFVEQALGIEFAQPVQGERLSSAAAQQQLAPVPSVASMRTEPSTEKAPPCAHCPIARASSSGSRLRLTKPRNSCRRTYARGSTASLRWCRPGAASTTCRRGEKLAAGAATDAAGQ